MAAAEFALVLPLLALLVLGCIDFGRFAYTYMAVTNSAYNAASYASTNAYANWNTGVPQAAENEMSQLANYNAGSLTVSTPVVGSNLSGSGWTVSVTVSYSFHTLITYPGVPSSINLSRTVMTQGSGSVPP